MLPKRSLVLVPQTSWLPSTMNTSIHANITVKKKGMNVHQRVKQNFMILEFVLLHLINMVLYPLLKSISLIWEMEEYL